VDISGGEPFLYPDFVKLVNNFPRKHLLALSTNLRVSESVLESIDRQFFSVTCSIHHPIEENFIRKAKIIQRKTLHKVILNFVAYPSQTHLIKEYYHLAIGSGFKFHLEPYVDISKIARLNESRICSAGLDYFLISPDADAWRCNSSFCFNYYKQRCPELFLGNLIKGDFQLLKRPRKCNLTCVHGCDLYFRGLPCGFFS